MTFAFAALLSYLAGSVPFGLVIARVVSGEDIRSQGSGNIGATNVARVLGAKWGVMVLVLDAFKGALPTALVPMLLAFDANETGHAGVLCGLMAIIGHMFPVWLGFRGGKGVATALGVVCVLGWQSAIAAFVVFLIVFAASRIISLSSMAASIAYAIGQFVRLSPAPFSNENWSQALFALLIPTLIIVRHRANIGRLLRGEEKRFQPRSKRAETRPAEDDATA